jgi:hypothetical protein
MTYYPQKIRLGTGRKNPRSCERKSAGADKLVRYLEQARGGTRYRDRNAETEHPEKDAKERRVFLFAKLKTLQAEKESLMDLDDDSDSERWRKSRRRELKEDVINMEILDTLHAIDELGSEVHDDKTLDLKR